MSILGVRVVVGSAFTIVALTLLVKMTLFMEELFM